MTVSETNAVSATRATEQRRRYRITYGSNRNVLVAHQETDRVYVCHVETGHLRCSCPHFTERLRSTPGAKCKHLAAIQADLRCEAGRAWLKATSASLQPAVPEPSYPPKFTVSAARMLELEALEAGMSKVWG